MISCPYPHFYVIWTLRYRRSKRTFSSDSNLSQRHGTYPMPLKPSRMGEVTGLRWRRLMRSIMRNNRLRLISWRVSNFGRLPTFYEVMPFVNCCLNAIRHREDPLHRKGSKKMKKVVFESLIQNLDKNWVSRRRGVNLKIGLNELDKIAKLRAFGSGILVYFPGSSSY